MFSNWWIGNSRTRCNAYVDHFDFSSLNCTSGLPRRDILARRWTYNIGCTSLSSSCRNASFLSSFGRSTRSYRYHSCISCVYVKCLKKKYFNHLEKLLCGLSQRSFLLRKWFKWFTLMKPKMIYCLCNDEWMSADVDFLVDDWFSGWLFDTLINWLID